MKQILALSALLVLVGCEQLQKEPYEFTFWCTEHSDELRSYRLYINTKDEKVNVTLGSLNLFNSQLFENREVVIIASENREGKKVEVFFLKDTGLFEMYIDERVSISGLCSKSERLIP